MKKALIIAMDDYETYPSFKGAVKRDALFLRQLLTDGIFGQYSATLSENDTSYTLLQRLHYFFRTATTTNELLFYFSGHGTPSTETATLMHPIDSVQTNPTASSVSTDTLLDLISNSKARTVSIILDCCYGTHFLQRLHYYSSDQRQIPLHPLQTAKSLKSLQALCSDKTSFVQAGQSQFTNSIIRGIITGAAGGRKAHISLFDIAEYLTLSMGNQASLSRYFIQLGTKATDPFDKPHIISNNPFRGDSIPRSIIEALYLGDLTQSQRAFIQLKTIINTGSADARFRANLLVQHYKAHHVTIHPGLSAYYDNTIPKLSTTVPAFPKSMSTIVILYNTRNLSLRHKILEYFTTLRISTELVDIDILPKSDDTYLNLLEHISLGRPQFWIIDGELLRRLKPRYPELYMSVVESMQQPSIARAVYLAEPSGFNWIGSPLHQVCLSSTIEQPIIFLAEQFAISLNQSIKPTLQNSIRANSYNDSETQISFDEESFISRLEYHDSELLKHIKRRSPQPVASTPREPNFLLFNRAGSRIMAIVDRSTTVNPSLLQYTYQPAARATLLNEQELESLGFCHKQVHPMWHDPHRKISKIFVDANIFFQYLMFPMSRIILPRYSLGRDHHHRCYISSFIRTLQQFHGDDKVVFANIIYEKRFTDPLLTALIAKLPVFTRFAPTPSNSLHIGSLRTALISYLFSIATPANGCFHIRFDDTNIDEAAAQVHIPSILADLQWLGIPRSIIENSSYRQSGEHARRQYTIALDLFTHSDLTKISEDGAIAVDVNSILSAHSYWLDLQSGPRIIHGVQRISSNGHMIDYSLTWPVNANNQDIRFKYKFAGAIDDIIHNSIVIRDERQEHSGFTARQSIIIGLVRECLTFPRTRIAKDWGKRLRDVAVKRIANHSDERPLPFPCPPIYFHVSRVVSDTGRSFSKRNLEQSLTITHVRKFGALFPETVLSWCVLSLGSDFRMSLGFEDDQALVMCVARLGAPAFLSLLRGKIDLVQLWRTSQKCSIRLSSLGRLDFRVMVAMSPAGMKSFIAGICQLNGLSWSPESVALANRIYKFRHAFSGASEIGQLLTLQRSPVRSGTESHFKDHFSLEALENESHLREWLALLEPSERPIVRYGVFGRYRGPALSSLLDVLGVQTFLARLKSWRNRDDGDDRLPK